MKYLLILPLLLLGCSKETRACDRLVEVIEKETVNTNRAKLFEGCHKGAQLLRVYRGEDAYNRHLDCILMCDNLTQALQCDTIR
jgi:hypothetical protein